MKMGKIEAPDTHFLSGAEGWMELGDFKSALAELGYTVMEEKSLISVTPGLLDHTGQVISDETFRGEWTLVFFGFTF